MAIDRCLAGATDQSRQIIFTIAFCFTREKDYRCHVHAFEILITTRIDWLSSTHSLMPKSKRPINNRQPFTACMRHGVTEKTIPNELYPAPS